MNNLLTIARRELRAYWESAIGTIFVIVFLLVSVGLFISPFFTYPRAEMRQFFGILPIILCVFIPAVTMRLWAEDRKENTWEMLLTFPMETWQLVGGKFLASLVFYAVALAGTATIPIMLAWLGDPDPGPIFCAYLGSLLLGGMFLAMGLFFSGLFKDQIVAFVITLLACFAVFLFGTEFFTTILDGVHPGLGTTLADLVGVTGHFNSFGRGVIELGDLLFFLAWIGVFLFLNGFYLEGRSRPGVRTVFGTAVVLSVAIGLVFNWVISGQSLARFDMTQDKIYTVSQATKSILSKLKVPVQVKYYVTPRDTMPTGLKTIEQDVLDKLQEMALASGGKVVFRPIHMEAANVIAAVRDEAEGKGKSDKEEAIEKRMLDKGVKPFSVQALDADQVTSKLVYSSIGVAYKDKKEEIVPQIMPQTLELLEYRLVNVIYKLTRDKAPKVALVAPMSDVNLNPQIIQLLQQMGRPIPQSEDPYVYCQRILEHEKYDVARVKLTGREPLPEDVDTVVVINPKELNDRQRFEIARAIHEGKSVVMAVQTYEWNYQVERQSVDISRKEIKPGVNDFLKSYGVQVDENILMDTNHQPLTLSDGNPLSSLLGGGMTLNLPIHVYVPAEGLNQNLSITEQLPGLFYLWGTALKVDEEKVRENKLEMTWLFRSSDRSWTLPPTTTLDAKAFDEPGSGQKPRPLAVLLKGQFPFPYKAEDRPAWPKEAPQARQGYMPPPPEDKPVGQIEGKKGKLILVGCSQFFRKNFLAQGNLDFFLNCVDAVTLGDELVNVRGKKRIDRSVPRPSDGARWFWKFFNLGFVNIVLAAAGIAGGVLRQRSRDAYTMARMAQ